MCVFAYYRQWSVVVKIKQKKTKDNILKYWKQSNFENVQKEK